MMRTTVARLTSTVVRRNLARNERIQYLRQRWPVSTPQHLTAWRDYSTGPLRQTIVDYVNAWFPSWMTGWRPAPATTSATTTSEAPSGQTGGGNGSSSPLEPGELTVRDLLGLFPNGSQYFAHSTMNPDSGTLKVPLEPRQPGPGDNEPPGVYVMRGVSGIHNGDYTVVLKDDGKFVKFHNGEWYYPTVVPDHIVVGFARKHVLEEAQRQKRAS